MIYFIFAAALFIVLIVASLYIQHGKALFWPGRETVWWDEIDPRLKEIFLAEMKPARLEEELTVQRVNAAMPWFEKLRGIYEVDVLKEKPRVRWCNFGKCWECVSEHSVGYGNTMRDAWMRWRLWLPGAL